MKLVEDYWTTTDGVEIYERWWLPAGEPRAVVCLVHGLGEHSGRYEEVAECFTSAGLAIASFDLRGHGQSGGKRGHAASYEGIMGDIDHLLSDAAQRYPNKPRILYGHSLGGNLVLYYGLKRQPKIEGIIATSPAVAPAQDPGGKIVLAKIMKTVIPSFTMTNGLDVTGLSRDPQVAEKYKADPLVHDMISASLGLGLIESGRELRRDAAKFPHIPLLILQGTGDRLVNPSATAEFARSLGNRVTYKEYSGHYHELHNEPQKEEITSTLVDWINERLA